MSTTTALFDHAASSAIESTPRKGLLQWLIKSRERQGEARVREVLARMTDTQLTDIGFTVDQIGQVRKSGTIPASYWA